jgi:hypothetical protein
MAIRVVAASKYKNSERIKKARWEFVGTRAPDEIRDRYVGKIIERDRSYGDPWVFVGY